MKNHNNNLNFCRFLFVSTLDPSLLLLKMGRKATRSSTRYVFFPFLFLLPFVKWSSLVVTRTLCITAPHWENNCERPTPTPLSEQAVLLDPCFEHISISAGICICRSMIRALEQGVSCAIRQSVGPSVLLSSFHPFSPCLLPIRGIFV